MEWELVQIAGVSFGRLVIQLDLSCLVSEDIQYLDDGQLDNPYSGRVSAGNYTEVVTTKVNWVRWVAAGWRDGLTFVLLLLDSPNWTFPL